MFFFFKRKTAYEMRISDWSSDVCSSDLAMAMTTALSPERMMLIQMICASLRSSGPRLSTETYSEDLPHERHARDVPASARLSMAAGSRVIADEAARRALRLVWTPSLQRVGGTVPGSIRLAPVLTPLPKAPLLC